MLPERTHMQIKATKFTPAENGAEVWTESTQMMERLDAQPHRFKCINVSRDQNGVIVSKTYKSLESGRGTA